MEKIKLLVVDDIPQTRKDIIRLLYFEDDMVVVGEAVDGTDALQKIAELQPDVVLMDINMPQMDGITATERACQMYPQVAVVIISIQGESEYLKKAMVAGARDYLVKPLGSEEMAGTIRSVYKQQKRRMVQQASVAEIASPETEPVTQEYTGQPHQRQEKQYSSFTEQKTRDREYPGHYEQQANYERQSEPPPRESGYYPNHPERQVRGPMDTPPQVRHNPESYHQPGTIDRDLGPYPSQHDVRNTQHTQQDWEPRGGREQAFERRDQTGPHFDEEQGVPHQVNKPPQPNQQRESGRQQGYYGDEREPQSYYQHKETSHSREDRQPFYGNNSSMESPPDVRQNERPAENFSPERYSVQTPTRENVRQETYAKPKPEVEENSPRAESPRQEGFVKHNPEPQEKTSRKEASEQNHYNQTPQKPAQQETPVKQKEAQEPQRREEPARESTVQHQRPERSSSDEKPLGMVTAVFCGKGGVGKTTIATNLAVVLAQQEKKKVALVDYDLQFGDVSVLLNLSDGKNISDLIQDADTITKELIENYMIRHFTGIDILPAPLFPQDAEYITPDHTDEILRVLKDNYDYVIVDTAATFNEINLQVMDLADSILLVTTRDIVTIKNTKTSLNILESLNYRDKIRVVLNRSDQDLGVGVTDLEKGLEITVSHQVNSDEKSLIAAINKGVPVAVSNSNAEITRTFKRLSDRLTGKRQQNSQEKQSKGIINRMFSL
ncbi:response regulator [Dethiobacter alkaliphilus]|uniref:response regulator n=1 Tax=Dethiobacter alkaliphilus TaxID=427926 RepID=UPI002225BC4C|nr:response regulator [Dethiobacter alkaliphilus]MCW3489631.1 response regulator [Dethiobacter alkaliphilus]